MFVKKRLLLLLLYFRICHCDEKLWVLHLGEDGDAIVNEFVEKAVNSADEQQPGIQLASFYFDTGEDIETACDEISENTNQSAFSMIVDTTQKAKHREVAEKISANYGVPVIYINYANEEGTMGEGLVARFSPPNFDLHLIIWEIVMSKGISDAAIVYSEEYIHCKSLREKFLSLDVLVVFFPFDGTSMWRIVDTIEKMYIKNVFLVGKVSIERTKNDFKRGQVLYLISPNMDDYAANEVDVTIFPEIKNKDAGEETEDDEAYTLTEVFIYEAVLMGINGVRQMQPKLPKSQKCETMEMLRSSPPNFIEYLEKVETQTFLRSNRSYHMNFTLTIWTNKTSINLASYQHGTGKLEVNRTDLWQGIKPKNHYKILARIKPPFVYTNENTGVHYGYSIDLLNMIASILDFTYELVVLKGNTDYYANTSKGFIESMLDGKYDIGLGPVFDSVDNSKRGEVSYSIPYYRHPVGIKFVMKRSRNDSIFTFITVLEAIVWTCVLSAFFSNSFMLWASERFSPYSYRNNKEKYADDDEVHDFTAKECLWYCLTSLTPQGGGAIPKHPSGRLVVVTWWLFGFIFLASYTANLAAFLTLSKLKNPIEDFDDLYKQFKMRYAPLAGTDEEQYFHMIHISESRFGPLMQSRDYPLPNRYARMKQIITNTTYPTSIETALEWVYKSQTATEGYALLVDSLDARYLLLTRCNLIDVEEEVSKKHLAIAVPGMTLLKHDIDKAIKIIQQRRLDEQLEKTWWDENPHRSTDCVELEDDSEGIGIYNIGGVFLMIFVGIGVAMIVMAYDYFMYKRRQTTKVSAVKPAPADKNTDNTVENEQVIPKKEDDKENKTATLLHRNVDLKRY